MKKVLLIFLLTVAFSFSSPTTVPWVVMDLHRREECAEKWEECRRDILEKIEALRKCAEQSTSYRAFLECREREMGEKKNPLVFFLFAIATSLFLSSPLLLLLYLDRKREVRDD